jgi:hypothetical protein
MAHNALLDGVCAMPGCSLLNRDHSAEQTAACLERWLSALDEGEVRP